MKSRPSSYPSLLFIFLLLLTGLARHGLAETADIDISRPVHALHETLLENMKQAQSLDFQQRYTRLEPVIDTYFDTPLISRVILGRYWKTLDEQQQADFIQLFEALTVANYANRFDSYNEQQFNLLGIEPMKSERYLVKTELVAPGEESVSLDYIIQKDETGCKIISVIANGVNDLSLKRAEYSAVIRDKGFAVLLEDIRLKVAELKQE